MSKLGLSSIEDDTVGKKMGSGLLFGSQRNGLGSVLVDDTYDVDNILKLVLYDSNLTVKAILEFGETDLDNRLVVNNINA